VNGLSVIIPSKTFSNLLPCALAVREHEPKARIIVVDDGIEGWTKQGMVPCLTYAGERPFIYSRNNNIGIRGAGADDVVLLNDDAILKTAGGFTTLQRAAEEHPEFGIIASTTNCVGNTNQHPKGIGLREDPRMVCFIAVFIPRRTIDVVGLLDEEFSSYGFEDDSYCLRIRRAGLKIGIHDGCFVDHASLKSTFRGDPRTAANLESGRRIFIKKWGSYPL
jgi:GT2 family glycosyltransferase